ncbi:MFS transporter [Pseudoduganella danionis]|uniref:MFS transporter n=1 Tax=Pseudoduganella danionis TaxID=1890295 RepID=A0ABW9SK28_9BURK|nr:MFS transporter [Pseudoduganella danionis]MTW32350.1 MFS transporter [Pseudoduganella danionis]
MSHPAPNQRAELMRNSNFQWLLRGGVISMLGDQLTMVALPWLVLKLTGDTMALGLVIALMSIPRAAFMLIGGAVVDQYSPKRVLMLSKYANAILLGLLALLVLRQQSVITLALGSSLQLSLELTPHITLMLIYALALGIGLAQAFGVPSGTSIMPQSIPAEYLQAANGVLMGLRQLSMLLGPVLAAVLLTVFGASGNSGSHGVAGAGSSGIGSMSSASMPDAHGLAAAFALDSLSFIVSALTLSRVTTRSGAGRAADASALSVWSAIGAGLLMVWRDVPLRLCFIYWGTVSLFIGGSMQVALPVLASDVLHGASALGLLLAANGAGTLLGMGAAAAIGARLRLVSFGAMILLMDALAGVLVMGLGAAYNAWLAGALLLLLGVLSGYVQINVFTWIQRRVPPQMMGRAMSIFMFIFMGLAPISAAATGWLLKLISLSQLFVGGGIILVIFAVLAYLFTPIGSITANTPDATQAQ